MTDFYRGIYKYVPYEDWEFSVTCDYCGGIGPHKVLLENVQDKGHNLVECSCGLRFFEPRIRKDKLYAIMRSDPAALQEARCCCFAGVLTQKEADATSPDVAIAYRKQYYGDLYQRYLAFRPRPAAHVPPFAPRIFELGGNVGWFSKRCLEMGADPYALKGCDFNPYACRLARCELALNFWPGAFEDYPVAAGEEYDLLLAMDVIEHTLTPHADMRKLRSLAAEGAHLILKTFCDDLDTKRCQLLPPCHSYHFTQATLRRCLEEVGWRILVWDVQAEQVLVMARL